MTDKDLEQDELDRRIIRELSRLPFHAPSPGFERRVMGQVRLPAPRLVVALHRAQAWAMEPRRAFALAAAYSLCAVVGLGVAVPWLMQHSAPVHTAWDTAAAWTLAVVRDVGMSLAALVLTSKPYETLREWPFLRQHLVPLLALVSAAYAAAGVALHHLLKDPRGTRVPVATQR